MKAYVYIGVTDESVLADGRIDGVLSEEMAELIEKYFTALFSPSNKD